MDNLHIATYNCSGLGHTHRDFVNYILDAHSIDILLIQETWLLETDIANVLSSLHNDYLFTGISGMDSTRILHGRPYGGVAVLWRKSLAGNIKPVRTGSNRITGVKCTAGDSSILILSVYMPTDSRSILTANNEFENCVKEIDKCIEELNCTYTFIGGDLNVDLQRRSGDLACMIDCAYRNNLKFMWEHEMKPDGITFSAPNMTSEGSRIDHFLVSHLLSAKVIMMEINDILTDHGHRPLGITFDLTGINRSSHSGN